MYVLAVISMQPERVTYSKSSNRNSDLLKIQQEREKELFKIQQEREKDLLKIQQERERAIGGGEVIGEEREREVFCKRERCGGDG